MMEAQCVISSEREAYELHTWYTDDKDPHHRQAPLTRQINAQVADSTG